MLNRAYILLIIMSLLKNRSKCGDVRKVVAVLTGHEAEERPKEIGIQVDNIARNELQEFE